MFKPQEIQVTSYRVQVQNKKSTGQGGGGGAGGKKAFSRGIWSLLKFRLTSATSQNKHRAGGKHSSFHLVSDSHNNHLTQYES